MKLILVFFVLLLQSVNGQDQLKPFDSSWESLQRYETPEWFQDAKLGIYVHWGIYSVAERGEWYGRNLYIEGHSASKHHRNTYGHPSEFGYKDLIPKWKGENFDANQWLDLFKAAGARYFTPCAVHHDGFDLWDSRHNEYNSVKMGPKRDVIMELMKATRQRGLRWGVTTHLARNYNWLQHAHGSDSEGPQAGISYDGSKKENRRFYHEFHGDMGAKYPKKPSDFWKQNWTDRIKDLIDNYDLDFLYFDGAIPFDIDDGLTGRKVLAYYYNKGLQRDGKQEVVMTIKAARDGHGIYKNGVATLDLELNKMKDLKDFYWQTDDSIGAWGYNTTRPYKTSDQVIDKFIDIVSKNGNLLLNVPPKADGTFDEATLKILSDLGEWNQLNGEAIFSTRPWIRFEDGNVRFTRSKNGKTLYAILLVWPEDGKLLLPSLKSGEGVNKIDSISLIGADNRIRWTRNSNHLSINLPNTKPCKFAYAFRIQIE